MKLPVGTLDHSSAPSLARNACTPFDPWDPMKSMPPAYVGDVMSHPCGPGMLSVVDHKSWPLLARKALVGVMVIAAAAKLCGTLVTLSSGWRGGFIIPLFFMGAALGRMAHTVFPHANEVVLMACLMAAINVGVTKTTIGSTLVVTEMAGLQLLPMTLIAAIVALLLTSEVVLIESQREREGAFANP